MYCVRTLNTETKPMIIKKNILIEKCFNKETMRQHSNYITY